MQHRSSVEGHRSSVEGRLDLSNFTLPNILHHAAMKSRAYASALPFPHMFFDDLFPRKAALAVASEIPERMLPSGCVASAAACYRKPGVHYRKSELHSDAMGPYTKRLFQFLRSGFFVQFLEALSGIGGLVPDPGFEGSGVHMTGDGGVLAVHHDFNWMLCSVLASGGYTDCGRPGARQPLRGHAPASERVRLHRRVNVFLYLNHDWHDDYGGHLELWSRNLSYCEHAILPTMGRFAVFSSSDYSFHGHPRPLRLPRGRMRRSIAFYYYTRTRPAEECERGDCDTFRNAVWQQLGKGDCAP